MPVLESVEAWDDEAFDDESLDDEAFDDESVDDESEFLGTLLGGPAALIGNALGGLFGGGPRPPSRSPLPRITVGTPGAGVSTASLNTPAGNATLRLPEPVVTRREYDAGIRKLQEGINRDAARVNAVAKDVDGLRTRIAVVVGDTQRDIAKVRKSVALNQRNTRRTLARLRREQSSQQMMSMIMGILAQKNAQDALEDHTHLATGAATNIESSNPMMMMLPMMMMGQGGGGNDNSMMMMMPMMMLLGS